MAKGIISIGNISIGLISIGALPIDQISISAAAGMDNGLFFFHIHKYAQLAG